MVTISSLRYHASQLDLLRSRMRSAGQDDSLMVKCVSWRPEGRLVEAAIVVEEPAEDVEEETTDVLEVEVGREEPPIGVEVAEGLVLEVGKEEAPPGVEAVGGLEEELMITYGKKKKKNKR